MNASARTVLLDKLRRARRQAAPGGFSRPRPAVDLRRAAPETADFAVFAEKLTALGPTFELAATPEAAREALAGVVARENVKTAVRWDHPDLEAVGAVSVLEGAGVTVLAPEELPERACPALGAVDMGLTGVDYALGATGSLILAAAPGRPRAVALVPRLHVALVAASRLLPDLPALCDRLAGGPMPSAVNCVSGVSSTGDIEFVYVRGVHGPLAVHVIGLGWL
ncbi:MAG: lactate utilization protein [Solidesulfovibrio sp.]|uniref:LutC/YkgG family protein n=1 Tax=Solidesulfovibrio sp. TaxID=2910990 RepID=UPI002B216A6C|nr:lactate utilization protein [Solidesulfovibrio sp.]MEA4856533.1 lactate utilization protein [Solidesulfovibrio sp.]